MSELCGLPLEQAERILAETGKPFTVSLISPPRPREAGTLRVVRVSMGDGIIALAVCGFRDGDPPLGGS